MGQNAAHLLECPRVGDGEGGVVEKLGEGPEWCREVVRFLHR